MERPPARITVSRQAPEDVKVRQILMSLDGQPLATLYFGDEVTREVEPGPHRLRANNTLVWKTLDVDLQPGEHARFVVVNTGGLGTMSFLGVLGVGPLFVKFERVPDPPPAAPAPQTTS